MKYFLCFLIASSLIFGACQKDEESRSDAPTTKDESVEFVEPEIVQSEEPEIIVEMDTFASPDVDVSFDYRVSPDGYTLNASPGENAYGITLMRTEDLLAMADLEGTEGPGSINIIAFPNTDSLSAIEWTMINTQYSNFAEGSSWEELLVHGETGVYYEWDGLYPGESIVVSTPETVYLFSLSTNTNVASMQEDFFALIETVEFYQEAQ